MRFCHPISSSGCVRLPMAAALSLVAVQTVPIGHRRDLAGEGDCIVLSAGPIPYAWSKKAAAAFLSSHHTLVLCRQCREWGPMDRQNR